MASSSELPLHVSAFSGVVLEGSADQRGIDELLQADSIDVGPRGALIASTDVTPYLTLLDGGNVPAPWTRLYALLAAMPGYQAPQIVAVGEGATYGTPGSFYMMTSFSREGVLTAPLPVPVSATVAAPEGVVVTGYPWPGVWTLPNGMTTEKVNVAFFCLGAREGFAPKGSAAFGLYVAVQVVNSGNPFTVFPISSFTALGAGPYGDGTLYSGSADVGTHAQQLYFRGVIAWNDFLFGWGFDSTDAANGDGPARVMFCNLGLPLKWGNDNLAAVLTNRAFTDSDAIILGDAGEIVRGAIMWAGKLWFGTNQQLHYIAGYGRDSFLTDGATPVQKAFNIVGPTAMLEGCDRALYGVSDQGLWRTRDGASFEALFRKLVDFDGKSLGYWDCIWTDLTQVQNSYPGQTNQDLVWMVNDRDRRQVVIGIPWCSMANGYGYGLDTCVIKFHVDSNGFTRQWFPGVQYTAAAFLRREGQQRDVDLYGTATAGQATVSYYGYEATQASSAVLPSSLPVVTMGPYAPFGPDGRGQLKRLYATVAWENASCLPLVFQVTPYVDQQASDTFALTIGPTAPTSPVANDLWLDTSETDTNLGNGTAGAITPAFGEYLLRAWASGGFWRQLCGLGTNGRRATIRMPLNARTGTRLSVKFQTLSANGRFQWESLAEDAGGGKAAA